MNAFVQPLPILSRSHRHATCRPRQAQIRVHARMTAPISAVTTPVPAVTPAAIAAPASQKSPAATYEAAVTLGCAKAGLPAWKVVILGILAGAYIAIGALLALCIGGALPGMAAANPGLQKLVFGVVGLPTGLTMVCVAGGELFTGNTALITSAVLSGRADVRSMVRNWVWSYAGNLVGSLLVVWLVCASSTLTGVSATTAAAIATAKTGMSFKTAFFKGVFCNWLVCLAVYMQNGASDFAGKFLAILLPISAFVAMGLDHSVANMFLVPVGIKMGAAVTFKKFLLANLLPVTLGNMFAGVVLVGGLYSLAYGKRRG